MPSFPHRIAQYAGLGLVVFGSLTIGISLAGLLLGQSGAGGLGIGVFLTAFGAGLRTAPRRLARQGRLEIGTVAGLLFGGFGGLMVLGGLAMVIDDPGGFALMAFGAVFMGVGYLAHRFMRTPRGMKAVPVFSQGYRYEGPLGRHGSRTRTISIYVDEHATEAAIAEARRQWWREQWTRRPDWVAGRIVEESARTGSLMGWSAAFINLVVWGIVVGAMLIGDPPWGLLAVPIGVGLLIAGVAVRDRLRLRRFGPSSLALATTPAYLGDRLVGTTETGVQERHAPADGFHLRLVCADRFTERDTSGSGSTSRTREIVLWEQTWQTEGTPTPGLPRRLAVPIDVPLPADQPPTMQQGNTGTCWRLEVTAAVPGLDYGAAFELPVFHRADVPQAPESSTGSS